jgi:tetratricopeptide (TPR) repeat protein
MVIDETWREAQQAHAAGEITRALALTRDVLDAAPDHVEALEHLANVLVTRQRRHAEGLAAIDRVTELRPDDAGSWYARGWLYEFAAHEIRRRPSGSEGLTTKALYEKAAASFRRCLDLHPDGRLEGDALDLLDHVENELRSL